MSDLQPLTEKPASPTPQFSHPSEAEFAHLLDFYGIPWRYEPRTFVLEEDEEGHPLEAFSPDFYLPDQDLYVEVTTLRQKLITKKNRKIRRLRERYPNINIKLFTRRDFRTLLAQWGMIERHDDLIGQAALNNEPDHLSD
jgi:hypoxanthine phosphoribosyltransferase